MLTRKSTTSADASRRTMNAARPKVYRSVRIRARGSKAWRSPSPKMFTAKDCKHQHEARHQREVRRAGHLIDAVGQHGSP